MTARPITVAVGGFYEEHLRDNYLFTHADAGIGDNLLKPLNELHATGRRRGVEFATFDRVGDLDAADAFLFLDFPRLENPLVQRALASARPKFLFTLESPIVRPANWLEENHRFFTKVFTYLDPLVDDRTYVKINYAQELPVELAFSAAGRSRLCTMIAGAKRSTASASLYGERLAAIRWFEQHRPHDFDLYGLGWDPAAFPSYRGRVASKRDVLRQYRFSLCYENVRDVPGYITEKIFDCFLAGCVPVYRGANNVADHIPRECFIDRRDFASYPELHAHLACMSQQDYARHQDAIRAFLAGPASEPFSTRRFCDSVISACVAAVRCRRSEEAPALATAPASSPVPEPRRADWQPKISVYIPTYNRAGFLRQAVGSVLAQDYRNLEILIGDNASTDATEAVCAGLTAADRRIRYFRNSANIGSMANSRNLLYEFASGDYVLVLCDDDYLHDPTYLSKAAALVARHREDPPVLVFSNSLTRDERSHAFVGGSDFRLPEYVSGTELFERWWQSFGGDPVFIPLLTCLFHRETAIALDGLTTEAMAADTILWWRLLLVGNAGFVDTRAAVYRVHGANDSIAASIERHLPNLWMFIDPARLAIEAGYDLDWVRAWKSRMAAIFLSTIAHPSIRQAFLQTHVAEDLVALYRRARDTAMTVEAERVEEDRIVEGAIDRLRRHAP